MKFEKREIYVSRSFIAFLFLVVVYIGCIYLFSRDTRTHLIEVTYQDGTKEIIRSTWEDGFISNGIFYEYDNNIAYYNAYDGKVSANATDRIIWRTAGVISFRKIK